MHRGKKLFLLDVFALIYRAHFALHHRRPTNSEGIEMGALLGFANTLVDVLNKQSPSHVIAAFDREEPTWRKELYSDYKAHRDGQPEGITAAIPYSKKMLEGFGIPCVSAVSYEADDVIGTLATQGVREGFDVYIVSTDKDLGQLVDVHTWLYKPGKRGRPAVCWGEDEVVTYWGIKHPIQLVDILGLSGDSSDNIPGVPMVGPKTAQRLIREFGSIEGIYEQLEEIEGSLQARLHRYKSQALLSKKLATINRDIPLKIAIETGSYVGPHQEMLEPLLTELGFRALAKRLFGTQALKGDQLGLFGTFSTVSMGDEQGIHLERYDVTKVTYVCVETLKGVRALVGRLERQEVFCLDTETTGLDTYSARLLGIGLSWEAGKAYFIPIPKEKKALEEIWGLLRPLFEDEKRCKVGHNIKFDVSVLHWHGLAVRGPFFDTMIAHHLLVPEGKQGLNALAERYLGYAPIEIESLIGKRGKDQGCLDEVPLEKLVVYGCEDADITLQLYAIFAPRLEQEGVDRVFYEVSMPLLPVLAKMEQRGIALDKAQLGRSAVDFTEGLARHEETIYQMAGSKFNIDSPKQLGKVLFEELRIVENPAKTAKGSYATGEGVLKTLEKKHAIIKEVLSYRELKKLMSTYVAVLPRLAGKDGRIRTSYHQGLVSTGRLSSSNPNLQNVPIRTRRGRSVRRAFVAGRKGYRLLSADYSQIELRIMAHFTQDARMISPFEKGQDIHTMTAVKLFKVGEKEVTSVMRRKAKMVNFGIIYGISPFGLAQRLDISRKEGAEIIQRYFKEFPAVQVYMKGVVEEAHKRGYVTTLLGRKRALPDINSRNATMRKFAERYAINMPIQGTAAELIQCAMIRIEAWLQQTKLRAQMILQVHDELIFEVHTSEVEALREKLPELMGNALPLTVPITVNIGVGKDWLAAH